MKDGIVGGARSWAFADWILVASIALAPGFAQAAEGPGHPADGACQPGWIPTFGEQPGVGGPVSALEVFDDGSGAGPALYAGGAFTAAGGVQAGGIARWDGATWSPLGDGVAAVETMQVFDDGSGPALYVGGSFTNAGGVAANNVARWDGASWSPLGAGVSSTVSALTVFDDGSGSGLYAGGWFTTAGGVAANHVAKWNGASWAPLGTGMDLPVNALAVFDDGSGGGPALYAGGWFTTAGGVASNHVAKWNGASWAPLGSGTDDSVSALAVFDDGSGQRRALCAGGEFEQAGGSAAGHVAKWDGASWSPIGGGFNRDVATLTVFDDGGGGGPALHAGGLTSTGAAKYVAKWDGAGWLPLGSGVDGPVSAMTVFDDGAGGGPALFVGGVFWSAGGIPANRLARWDGASWSATGSGVSRDVGALAVFDDGSGGGPALFAGGELRGAGGVLTNRIGKWDGASWSPLGSGLDNDADALTVFDDGSGSRAALFVGGTFHSAGGVAANRIAKWDGASWSPLGSGVGNPGGGVNALAVFDDGSGGGPALFAGGSFSIMGGVAVSHIARWDGASWSPLGSGVSGGRVEALAIHDDGSGGGPALYAGGWFESAGGLPASHVAKWDGASWSPLGSGVDAVVMVLAVFDDGGGGGPELYAGGLFTAAGGLPASHIAKWDGASWSPLGSGVDSLVEALAVFDDGSGGGPTLYAGGLFTTAGGSPASHVARWDGASWSSLGSAMDRGVYALTVFDDGRGDGPALHAGGGFSSAFDDRDSFLARWGGCSAGLATTYCTAGTSASGCQAALSARGVPSATAPSGFVLSAAHLEGAKGGLYFFGTNGRQASPWGNGTSYQCVVPPTRRAGLLTGSGTAGLCDGSLSQDLNAVWCPTCPKPQQNPGAGATVQAQLWYRDPFNTSNQTTGLSDAIEFLVGP